MRSAGGFQLADAGCGGWLKDGCKFIQSPQCKSETKKALEGNSTALFKATQ